jgi:hypothetical protein
MFIGEGKDARHLLELMWPGEDGSGKGPGLDFSRRREARKKLKNELSYGASGRSVPSFDFRRPSVVFTEDIRKLMVKRQIL